MKKPLREVLLLVGQQYGVTFSYLNENTEGIFVETPPPKASLSEVLTFLGQQSNLTFTQLNERFIAISKTSVALIDICGFIEDDKSKERLAGVVVQAGHKIAISNSEGYFSLSNVPELALVKMKLLGYAELHAPAMTLLDSPCKTIEFSLQSVLLNEVIITNYLTIGIRKLTEGSLSILTKELGIHPGLTEPDVLFMVQSLPGIQSVDESVSNINVRGGMHDQNLVLWDGMKMYQQGHFFGLISAFNPYFTKEVNLIKNGTSSALSDGVSSTLDIRSEDKVIQKFTGGAGTNMINADAFTLIPLSRKASLNIATRRSISDVVETPTYRSYYDRAFRGTDVGGYSKSDTISAREKFHFYDFSAKLLYDISDRDELRVSVLKIHNSIDYTEIEQVNGLPESKVSSLEQQSIAAGIRYNRLWNSRVRTAGQWYVSRYDLDGVNHDILNSQRVIQDNEVLDMGVKLDARVSLSNQLGLFSGYQFFEVGVTNLEDVSNPPFYRLKKTVLRTHVLFTEANYNSVSGNTYVRAGVRANLFSGLNVVRLEPRVAISQKMSDAFSLELLGEMKSQTTTQVIDFQNDFLGVEKRRWIMSNNMDIPIIKSKQLSVGAHFSKRNFLIVVEGYYKEVDGITTSSQGFQNQFESIRSVGSYETRGIDFLINRRFRKFNSWISYSNAKSNYRFDELTPPIFPTNLDIRHRATSGLSYQSKHLELSSGINWRTGRPFTQPIPENSVSNGEIQYQSPNTSRLRSYWRIDVSAKYKFNLSDKIRGIAGVSIWNVLDHNNVIDTYYQLDDNNQIDMYQRSALTLTPNMMFRVEF